METTTLLKANIKRHKGSLIGILLLTFFVAVALGTVLTVWTNSGSYIQSEIERAGFGELTAWVSGIPEHIDLSGSISSLPEIDRVETQRLIYANYTINGQESDSEGQLITYMPNEHRYKFFANDLSGHAEQPNHIAQGETYVSASMVSMFGVEIGDTVTFPIARAGKNLTLTVKGFYEDPFMGSSMIGMKGFLINEADRNGALDILQNAGIDALARNGAMLHIFPKAESKRTVSELNGILNEQTAISEYSEDVHSRDAIAGFMLILQSAFSGLLLAFAAVLLFVVLVALSHSIGSTIASDYVNMGILKTIGLTAWKLRLLQLLQYLLPILSGMLLGFIAAVPLSRFVVSMTLTTTGVLIPALPPVLICIGVFVSLLLLLIGFILIRTRKIEKVSPMKAIRKEVDNENGKITLVPSVLGKGISLRLALRQLISGKKRYIGALIVATLLVFFASLVGRMNSWLGTDGKGMMDAFNPADHDIGIQSFGELTQEKFEQTILTYTNITNTYVLAMPSVAVNGVDYTANVIDQPERFHILEGRTCISDNEIVLTEFVAKNFGVSIGDIVMVRGDSGSSEYTVSGIYSCANDMGDNVGLSREGYLKIGRDHPNLWCWHYFLADPSQKSVIAETLENSYGGDIHVHENTWPGLLGIISAMQALVVFMYAVVMIFILIVTVLTGSKILAAIFIFTFALTGCSNSQTEREQGDNASTGSQNSQTQNNRPNSESNNSNNEHTNSAGATELEVYFGDRGSAFIMHLYDNDTAAAIARHVGTADWRLPIYHYDDYDNWEVMQYYDIPSRYDIPSNPESITLEKAGEVYYSEPNRIILFYGDAEVSGEYTKVGYFDFTEEFKSAVENNPVLEGWGNKIILISSAD